MTMMTDRIARLRKQSIEAQPVISMERASLLTRFYSGGEADGHPVPVARAMAFRYILENKELCLNDGELIVGERGPGPKETPTYPEICTHTQNDLEVLDTREKVRFSVSGESKKIQEDEIAPFWQGRSMRDRLLSEMTSEWKDAYDAGIFTEFQEQRAPGHTVLDDKIYRKGFDDFRREIRASLDSLDMNGDPEARAKRDELQAMDIAADALKGYARRYSLLLSEEAKKETDPGRKAELDEMARICAKVPASAPDTFWEALQYYWFVHLGVITELNTWDSFNPGRLDRHLYPFYLKGLEDGSLTKERAREILQSFWIKFNNQPAPPKVGVTAQESSTYTDFCLINLGGVDDDGEDAVNELTFLILDVIEEMRLLQPSSMVQVSRKNPDDYLKRALRIIRTGYGQPSIFNTEAIIAEMTRMGKSVVDARNGGASGCVETGAFGKESYILTGYFNIPKVLEIAMHNGIDPSSGKRLGPETGELASFDTFDSFYEAFERQLRHFIDIKIEGNLVIERLWSEILPAPFLSILIDDCIKNGRDYNSGGARYNTSYIQGVGLGTITDCLAAVKWHVYEKKTFGMDDLAAALDSDFIGAEDLRKTLLDETPKYGNDEGFADNLSVRVFESYFSAIDGRPNFKSGHFRINLLPTTCHVYFGSVTGALPDGRKAREPLSEGISPVQGADRKGPTAVIKSASRIDHLRTGGTLLNQKFTPGVLEDQEGLTKVAHLVRSYFTLNGHHIQFNVVNAETLRKAQETPEKYRDLIVRVAGYSDYFVDLGVDLQNEIIKRTEHGIGQ
jgi:formate C-acetyltransferase